MKRPQFTIMGLLQATALIGAFIAAWKLLDAWFPLEHAKGMDPGIVERMVWLRGVNQATFMLCGVTFGARLKYKRQHWWLPGAWIGLGIGMVVWVGNVLTPSALSMLDRFLHSGWF